MVGDDPAAVETAVLLAARIGYDLGAPIGVGREGDTDVVELRIVVDPAELPVPRDLAPELAAEAYRLEVDADRVVVSALDARGLLRGLATLEQLAHPVDDGVLVPPVLVVDHPRFAWRGLCVDVARHWFGPETLRTIVGLLYSLKLNVLHLHLTDDQGWRIESPSHPSLAEVSGRTAVGGDPGGFLTAGQFAALVTFAEARGITVVPEIDLPGHVNAALHACAELTPGGEGRPAYTGVGVGFSRLHAELPATIPFVSDVLADIAEMTPGPYVHIGGDEALTMHAAEYDHLVGHAARVVAAAGKTVVGWQEALRTSLPPGSLVQYWDERPADASLTAALDAGIRLVFSPASRLYLDMRYDPSTPVGSDWAGFIDLRRAYEWDPVALLGVPESAVAGVEAAIWTENVRTPKDLFGLLLPRLAAVAEVAWSPGARTAFHGFTARLRHITPRWDAQGLPWHRGALAERPGPG
ncbi:hypothetical protein N867_08645 [Actinotalea fermentans ATCC 43279 = JCM 9966 = DSM 3133]|uniref:beta-N-acetylhexosaminidase n=1 Tax=Actinotalea fermentans TaxID=43671 RepID=A0A511YX21_9CELL|nr:hypothetical protein N867_08645 [Actinotalea fermentans ATCC 43279 = JCM 9966 = DSM 3133]GEN79747.1 beta-N-acetylhexosaminidase [Actinotalea fermentans]